ncbi:MAG: hypothetical protein AABW75_00985 [Nanoarchaeota archaeon]
MKDEIQSGLKNAIDRGSSLKDAVQTFINAGYNPVEVNEAANAMGYGATNMTSQDTQSSGDKSISPQVMTLQSSQQTQQQKYSNIDSMPAVSQKSEISSQSTNNFMNQTSPSFSSPFNSSQQEIQQPSLEKSQKIDSLVKQKSSKKTKIIIFIAVLLLLVGAVIATIIFKDKILALFESAPVA